MLVDMGISLGKSILHIQFISTGIVILKLGTISHTSPTVLSSFKPDNLYIFIVVNYAKSVKVKFKYPTSILPY